MIPHIRPSLPAHVNPAILPEWHVKLAVVRARHDLTRGQVAAWLGVSIDELARMEEGQRAWSDLPSWRQSAVSRMIASDPPTAAPLRMWPTALRRRRLRSGQTATQLSARLGCSAQLYNRIERGAYRWSSLPRRVQRALRDLLKDETE